MQRDHAPAVSRAAQSGLTLVNDERAT